jgi:hypothetical protein
VGRNHRARVARAGRASRAQRPHPARHRAHLVAAASRRPTSSPESAHPVCSARGNPVNSADPTAAARRAGRGRRGPCLAARSRHTCRRGRRPRIHWACRSARWGRTESGRRDSGRHRAGRKGWAGWPAAGRQPSQRLAVVAGPARRAGTSVRQPRSLPAVPRARVPRTRRSLRPARRHWTVAGPDRRWPRWSPNRPSGSLTCCPAEDRAREPVTARTGTCGRKGRLATVPTPDVIPYQGWTHGWTCCELDLSTQNGHRPLPGRAPGGRAGGCYAFRPLCQAETAGR